MPIEPKDLERAGQGSSAAADRIRDCIDTIETDVDTLETGAATASDRLDDIESKDLSIEVTDIEAEASQKIRVSARFVDHAGDPLTGARSVLVRATTARYGLGALASDITLGEVASQGTRGNQGAATAEYVWTSKADGTLQIDVEDDTGVLAGSVYLEFLAPFGADYAIRPPAKAVCTFA